MSLNPEARLGWAFNNNRMIVENVEYCTELAVLLEVSTYPKPGNVDRFHDFIDTTYEHYLSSAVVLGTSARIAAFRTLNAVTHQKDLSSIRLGKLLDITDESIQRRHLGVNTIFGTTLLLLPLAAGAAATAVTTSTTQLLHPNMYKQKLRLWIRRICRATTVKDAMDFYRALRRRKPGGLDAFPELDVPDARKRSSEKELRQRGLTLFEVMKRSASWDALCAEWTNGFHVTFNEGYPILNRTLKETGSISLAGAHCFLTLLAKHPDTLIKRKVGSAKALEIMMDAQRTLKKGSVFTKEGHQYIVNLDKKLRIDGNVLNPGCTADLTAASFMLTLLYGDLSQRVVDVHRTV